MLFAKMALFFPIIKQIWNVRWILESKLIFKRIKISNFNNNHPSGTNF